MISDPSVSCCCPASFLLGPVMNDLLVVEMKLWYGLTWQKNQFFPVGFLRRIEYLEVLASGNNWIWALIINWIDRLNTFIQLAYGPVSCKKCLFVCNLKLFREKTWFSLGHPAFMARSSGALGLIWFSFLSLDWLTSLGWR